jgi:hypothetical protein
METSYDMVIRVTAFVFGLWNAGHYFLGAVALKKAAPWEKLILFPTLATLGVGMCLAAVFGGSGVVFLVSFPMVVALSIKDKVIWSAGAYMSEVLDRRQRMREAERQAFNRYRRDLTTPYENVSDIVTPGGFDAIQQTERQKEAA